MSGEYKVSYRGSQRLINEKIPDGRYQDLLKTCFEPNFAPEDWERLKVKLKLSELSHTFLEQDGNYECEARIRSGEGYRWVRLQFILLDETNAIPRMMTMIATDIQESHSRNEQLMSSLKEAYKAAEEANKAKEASHALFAGGGDSAHMPTLELTAADFADGDLDILALLVKAELAPSRSDARRAVQQGGVSVADEKITDIQTTYNADSFGADGLMVKRGKKKFVKIIVK